MGVRLAWSGMHKDRANLCIWSNAGKRLVRENDEVFTGLRYAQAVTAWRRIYRTRNELIAEIVNKRCANAGGYVRRNGRNREANACCCNHALIVVLWRARSTPIHAVKVINEDFAHSLA